MGGISQENWLEPWKKLDGDVNFLVDELRRELDVSHPLSGIPVRAVGRRQDCDDFLFALLDNTGRFAAVHLTFSKSTERDPWPRTTVFADWTEFERDRMLEDHKEWTQDPEWMAAWSERLRNT